MIATSIVQGGQPPYLFVRTLADHVAGVPFTYEEDAVDELEQPIATSLRAVSISRRIQFNFR